MLHYILAQVSILSNFKKKHATTNNTTHQQTGIFSWHLLGAFFMAFACFHVGGQHLAFSTRCFHTCCFSVLNRLFPNLFFLSYDITGAGFPRGWQRRCVSSPPRHSCTSWQCFVPGDLLPRAAHSEDLHFCISGFI